MKKKFLKMLMLVIIMVCVMSISAIAVELPTDGTSANINNDSVQITQAGTYTITGNGVVTGNIITIDPDIVGVVNITIDNVNIDVSSTSGACAFLIGTNTNVNLTITNTNILKSGLNSAGLCVPPGASIEINGTGTLTAIGGDYGAGIGGGFYEMGGNITINNGNITATGGNQGAGIGGGYAGAGGLITIEGNTAEVTATGGNQGAGIGGGYAGAGGLITIEGNTAEVTATGGYQGAGIGGGHAGAGGLITIEGNTAKVTATGGYHGAGIGGGNGRAGGNITINNGNITATGGIGGAGIGGGYNGTGGNITIEGNTTGVTATGGISGAGIGGGDNSEGGTITINGGTVTATSEKFGAGIGGGYNGAGGIITITGGTLNATSTLQGAGIGGGDGESGGIITITGGTLNATSTIRGAGIGGGSRGSGGIIIITDGTINATAGDYGSGIGGGSGGTGGDIRIKGGIVTAIGGLQAAGIGGGASARGLSIAISGGEIYAEGGVAADSSYKNAGDDIGDGGRSNSSMNTVYSLSGSAAVFTKSDKFTIPIQSGFTYYEFSLSGNSAYGYNNFPSSWIGELIYGYVYGATINYIVDFVTDNGSSIDIQTINQGERVTEPNRLAKTGYLFGGWYTDSVCSDGNEWDFDEDLVTKTMTLHAKWVAIINNIPNRISTVSAITTASITVGNSYDLDLDAIFEDADNDSLNYKVSINGSNETTVSENYIYFPSSAGVTNLRFTANDGVDDSTDIYFVQLTTIPPNTNALTGTVIISDDGTPQFNDILTVNVSATNNTGTLSYQWKRGNIDIGTNSSNYTVTDDDTYENITVEITSNVETGTITSSNIIVPSKADYSGTVTSPVEFSHTHNSVILNNVDDYEYKEDSSDWQVSNAFTGLSADTAYTFTQRVAETNIYNASTTSSAITITTDSLPINALEGTVTIIGNAVYGEELTTNVSGDNKLGTLIYQWQADGNDIDFATSDTYTLTESEIGKVITCEVRDTDTGSGAKTSYIESVSTASVDKEMPNTPNAPTKDSSTTTSITLTPVGYEYRCNGGAWQDSHIFTGLTASTDYNFTQRIKETTTAYSSVESSIATFSTTTTSSGGSASSSGGSSTRTVVINEYTTEIPSSYIGKDKVFEVESDKAKISINGVSLSEYVGDDVEIFIQKIDSSYFNINLDGDFPEGIPVFDISLIVDGVKVPFESDIPIEIEFEVEGDYENHKMVAVYLAEDGSYEILAGVYDGKVMRFSTNHLSNYALMYVDKTFDDITTHWGKEAIEALASREVVKGIGDDRFNPNGEITRAEFVTIMVRYFDLTAYGTDLGYTDIEEDSWYEQYVWIAREVGILSETYGDVFEPNKAITREEMMYVLYKSLEVTNRLDSLDIGNDTIDNFADSESVDDYNVIASEYLISTDIINGSDDMVNPTSTTTRAEVAQMLYNLLVKLNN